MYAAESVTGYESRVAEMRPLSRDAGPVVGEIVAALSCVTRRYRNGVVALNDLSLELARGQITALLGPNGAGKSTTVKLLMGLSAPDTGEVRVFGADPRNASARQRSGVMLQTGRAPEMLKVREHLTVFRSYFPAPMPYAALVAAAGLEGIEERLFGQLSGGQKQRMLFALALAGDPDLIFLDEPTVGLDIEARRGMWAQIRLLAARGKTVLLTTHYLEEADALADRILVLNRGQIICEGTPTEVKQMGARLLAADSDESGIAAHAQGGLKLIRCATTLTVARLSEIPGISGVSENAGQTSMKAARPEEALREMLALDPHLHSLEVQSPLLEDAFLALTGEHG